MTIGDADAPTDDRTLPVDGLSDLLKTIERACRRALIAGALEAGTTALIAGLLVYCLVQLSVLAGVEALSQSTATWAGVLVGGTALLLGMASAWTSRPTAAAMSRRADSVLGLAERVSTTVQLTRATLSTKPIVPASQIRDTLDRRQVIDARRLVPIRPPAGATAVTILALIALLLGTNSDRVDDSFLEPATSPPAALGAAESATMAKTIEDLATAIEQDATEHNDPYLHAVARELAELSEAAGADGPRDRTELSRELASLRAHTADAYRLAGVSTETTEHLDDLFGEAMQTLNDPAGALRTAEQVPETEEAAEMIDAASNAANDPEASATELAETSEAGPPTDQTDAPPTERPAVNLANVTEDQVCYQEYQDCSAEGAEGLITEPGPMAETAGGAPPNDIVQAEQPGGMLIGPAADADRGEGILAGDGVQPLGDQPGDRRDDIGPAEEVLLPNRDDGEGQRIRIEAAPSTAVAAIGDQGPFDTTAGRTRAEQPVARSLVPPSLREAMARYFAMGERDE